MLRDGLRRCNGCQQVKVLEEYHRRNSGYQYACKECVATGHRADRTKSRLRSWKSHLKIKYGLTLDDFNVMLLAQSGRCGVCSEPMVKVCVDHCHDTGKIRGLLCDPCNSRLHQGVTEEWFRAAAKYLFG